MKIFFGTCRALLGQKPQSAPKPDDTKSAKKDIDKLDDADGPGAGGGYKPLDSLESTPWDADGPGAGGGYDRDDLPPVKIQSDGPGAGGGYDDDGVNDDDSDGPGAGGGYGDSVSSFGSMSGVVSASWTQPMTVAPTIDGHTYTITDYPALSGEWYIGSSTPVPFPADPKSAARTPEGKTK